MALGTAGVQAAGREAAGRRWLSGEGAAGWLLLGPSFAYAFLLLAIPIVAILVLSLWTQNDLVLDRTLTLANYQEAWTNPLYRTLMLRSLWISAAVTLITVLLAYPIAYYVSFHGGRYKALWLFLITIPFWTSYLLRVFAWNVFLGTGGVLNSGLIGLGVIAVRLSWMLYNSGAVVVTLAHAWAPFAILPIYASLEKLDRSLLEAATDLGDGPVRRFLRVTLPLSMPGVIAAALIVFIPTVGDYVTPRLVGGKDGVMIANMIQVQFGRGSNWPLGAALSVSVMLIVAAVSLLVVLAGRRFGGREA